MKYSIIISLNTLKRICFFYFIQGESNAGCMVETFYSTECILFIIRRQKKKGFDRYRKAIPLPSPPTSLTPPSPPPYD